jgi:tetratricopeptide (TPR) repeat protein
VGVPTHPSRGKEKVKRVSERRLDVERAPSAATAGTAAAPVSPLGATLRSLRLAAELTQAELGGERFSKEYVSQIERGKTRPTREAVAWLAARLGVDEADLRDGVSTDLRDRVEAKLARAEALGASRRHLDAAELFAETRHELAETGSLALELRALSGEAWARVQDGDARTAVGLLQAARELVEESRFSDVERAEILFRLGVCRFELASIATAAVIFEEALSLAAGSGEPCEALRADILGWRSRCHKRHRDFAAAREDVEEALELSAPADDRRAAADRYAEASLTAEGQGRWGAARAYAERAGALYAELNREREVGRFMLNLGGLHLLAGSPRRAIEQLEAALAVAVEGGSDTDAGRALGSLATVYLHLGDHEAAEERAREALLRFGGREEVPGEVGQAHLALGRALLERGRLDEATESFEAAGAVFERMGSAGHRGEAWVALGDVASRRGDAGEAARLYRIAAEALQDIRF